MRDIMSRLNAEPRAVALTLALLAAVAVSPAAGQEPSAAQELQYSGNELTPGTEHTGELADFHPQMNDGTYADCFQLRPRPGMEYTLTLRSDAFDSFLLVGVGTCDDVLIQFENDDFEEEGLDARLVFAAEYDLYSVYVNTYNPGSTGAYTLSVEARLLPLAPAAN
ncbi:MAG: hypothetical protein CMQ34_01590 [Gammaproteobacteria bacterium]|nr:hypothetical protein [Gammaproteobacteria bacterium]